MSSDSERAVALTDWAAVRLPANVERVTVLWPALAFHVLATPAEERPLNLLQQAVLQLCEAGVRDVAALAGRLRMDPLLLTRVTRELQHAGHLTVTMVPRASDGTGFHEQTPRLVYAFQSPFTGEVWPLAVEDLRPAPLVNEPGGRSLPMLGHNARVREVAFPGSRPLGQPTAAEVLKAVQGLRAGAASDAAPLGRVWFVDEAPQRVHVACLFYLPKPPNDVGGWRVRSPLGDDDDAFLRSDAEHAQRESPDLDRILTRLQRAASERFLGPYRQYLAEMEDQAESYLRTRLGEKALETLRPARDSLVVMERDHRSAQVDAQRAPTLRSACVTEAQKVLEHVTKRLLAAHPLPEEPLQQIRQGAKTGDEGLLRGVVREWNTTMPAVPHGMAVQSSREVVNASKGKASLRACVLASVVAAYYSPKHPLHEVLAQQPALLSLADDVARIRNTGAHEGAPPIPADQVDLVVDATLTVVAALAAHLPNPQEE